MNNIKLKVDGNSQLKIGNLVQGREITISSGDVNVNDHSSALIERILTVLNHAEGSDSARVKAVRPKIEELANALADEPFNNGKIKEMLSIVKQHHEWAFPAIAEIVKKVGPTFASFF
jgi:hypothetical protein